MVVFKNWSMKARFLLVIVVLVLSGTNLFAQKAQDLLGDWTIVNVELAPQANPQDRHFINIMTATFLKSQFHFKSSSAFSFDSPDEDLATTNAFWHFDEATRLVTVSEAGERKKAGKLMAFTVVSVNGKYFFVMDEIPLILTVKKK
jgi:hypothetical protein